jgi:ADP-ribose pyrophosphatase YjhB (NUDIX family)
VDYRFCSRCGAKLKENVIDHKRRLFCPACGFVQYSNPVPAAAVAIVQDGEILLVQRAIEPRKGLWSLPAGFIEIDESVQQCAVREVKEETNLDVELSGLLAVYSVFDDPRYICLLVVYSGKILAGELKCGDDASDAKFFPPSALPPIAFKVHRLAIEAAFQKRQGPFED